MPKSASTHKRITARKLMLLALCFFIGASLISTAVYMISGYISRFDLAFFESVSAFTTTGATAFFDQTSLPDWLHIFRACCQWLGGGATLIFLAGMLSNMDGFSSSLSADGALFRTGLRLISVAKRLVLTYSIMTVACLLLLLATGCSVVDSICMSMSTISTGGFVSGAFIENGITETVTVLFMIFTCINYTLYYHAIKKHFDKFDKNTELYALLCILIGGAVLVSGSLLVSGTYGFREAVENGIFHTVSSLSTTGFRLVNTASWPAFANIVLTALSFIGGSTLSPAGGIKIMRIIVVLRLISKSFTVKIHPRAVVTTKINEKALPIEVSSAMGSYFLTYFAVYIIGAFIISFEADNVLNCFSVTAALMNNVGPSFADNFYYAGVSPVMHILMALLMLAGRLELYAIMLPFSRRDSD